MLGIRQGNAFEAIGRKAPASIRYTALVNLRIIGVKSSDGILDGLARLTAEEKVKSDDGPSRSARRIEGILVPFHAYPIIDDGSPRKATIDDAAILFYGTEATLKINYERIPPFTFSEYHITTNQAGKTFSKIPLRIMQISGERNLLIRAGVGALQEVLQASVSPFSHRQYSPGEEKELQISAKRALTAAFADIPSELQENARRACGYHITYIANRHLPLRQ